MDKKLNAVTMKKEAAVEPSKFKAQNSNESIASVIFPWRTQRNEARKPIVSTTDTGKTITTMGFYMCMMSVMILTTGIVLTAASGWTLIYRIPYVYLSGGSLFLGTDSFTLIAGVLSFPCCWIAWMCHNDKKYYAILPVLMVLLSFTITMLSTGVGLAIVNKSKMNFDHDQDPPKLSVGHYRSILSETMTSAMANYGTDSNFHWSWNSVQKRLRCCGVNKAEDWLKHQKHIPYSCHSDKEKSEFKTPFTRSCLDVLSFELFWEVCFLIGVSFISLGVKVITLMLVISVYIHHKVSGNK